MNSRTTARRETDQTRREQEHSPTTTGFTVNRASTTRPSNTYGRQDDLKAATRDVVHQRITPLAVRAPRWPLPDSTVEHLIDSVSREIAQRYGGNHIVNRLEAEALVHHVLEEELSAATGKP